MSADVLAELVATTRQAVARRQAELPLSELITTAERRTEIRDFHAALAASGLSVIAEHKRSSPSAGLIRADLSLEDVVSAYERSGAAALSILTEESRFNGALADLASARAAAELPILRKDFIVEPYQVYEALAGGADAILLIVAALEPAALSELHLLAGTLGLSVVVEVHNAPELVVALKLEAGIIGINNRNLSTLAVDIETTYALLPQIPAGTVTVAESGFRRRAELERLAEAGVDAVLIGEALMRSPDVEAACRELTGVADRHG